MADEWPEKGRVKIARGKLYNESVAQTVYDAIRVSDPEKDRYFYNLFQNGTMIHEKVNPLFLDFI